MGKNITINAENGKFRGIIEDVTVDEDIDRGLRLHLDVEVNLKGELIEVE